MSYNFNIFKLEEKASLKETGCLLLWINTSDT